MRMFGVVVALATAVGPGAAPLAHGEALPADAAGWVELASRHASAAPFGNGEDPTWFAYDKADLELMLVIANARLGRGVEAVRDAGELGGIGMYLATVGGDPWGHAYTPAGMIAAGQDRQAETLLSTFTDAWTLADAHQMIAEVHAGLGDGDAFTRHFDRSLGLVVDAQAEEVRLAAEDPGYAFGGIGTPWFLAAVARDAGRLDAMRRLAEAVFADPAERAGVAAMAAQLEAWKGDRDRASRWLAAAKAGYAEALRKERASEGTYWPDFAQYLPEIVAAAWLLEGRDAAVAVVDPDAEHEPWRAAAMAHAATMLRRTGDADAARAAIDEALALPDAEFDADAFDAMHLARELVWQGRIDDARGVYERFDDPLARGFAALGIARGLIWPE